MAAIRKSRKELSVGEYTGPGSFSRGMARFAAAHPELRKDYPQADRDKMAKSGAAMEGGRYPIADEQDLHDAIHAVGRGGGSHDAIRRHIIARAKALGLSHLIPENWTSGGSKGDGDS